ncbi:MAG: hypothetical protein HY394_02245 [Candidatus Diapherotrites archaeon]|nr:hypothetical protein [Candidatus Diapherotrites archaeon]
MNKVKQTALFTCPECGAKSEIAVPTGRCLAFHECVACHKIIAAKKSCCVICDYSDKKCPVSAKH